MALYIFPPVTLYKIIFPIPVVMALLIILDHLLVLTICIHHLSHPLSLCGITYIPDSVKTSSVSVFKAQIPH